MIDNLDDRRELASFFLRLTYPAVLAQIIMGLAVTWLAWSQLDSTLAIAWFSILLTASLVRLWLIRRHRSGVAEYDADKLYRMEQQHTYATGLSGMAWGLVPWLAYQGQDVSLDHLTAAMIFGMAGSATATLAAMPRAYTAFAWPAVLPFVVKAIMIGGNVYYTAAAVSLFGVTALTYFNRTIHHSIVESIRLRRENAELVTQLRAEKYAAEEASRIKSLFLAGVSHDLKHPLNALGLYLGYLKTLSHPPPTVQRALPGMQQALGSMGNLLSRLLELSRLEAGEYRPRYEQVVLSDIFRNCAAQFTNEAAARGLRLRFVDTRITLNGDPALLQSILDNLVGNAVRYTEHGGIVVGVRRCGTARILQVVDSGPGLPRERIPLLFEAYRRFDDRERSQGGVGLGLALVHKQCELAGYRIDVNSQLGAGSRFAVFMPG